MKKRKRITTSKTKCANCCYPIKSNSDEFVTEISLNFNFKANKEPLKVESVLSSIFKLGFVNHLLNYNEDKEEVGVCESCSIILGNLVQFYTQFNTIRKSASYLAKQIATLDQFMTEIQLSCSQLVHNDNDVQTQEDDDCLIQEDNNNDDYYDDIDQPATPVIPPPQKKEIITCIQFERQEADQRFYKISPDSNHGPWVTLNRLSSKQITENIKTNEIPSSSPTTTLTLINETTSIEGDFEAEIEAYTDHSPQLADNENFDTKLNSDHETQEQDIIAEYEEIKEEKDPDYSNDSKSEDDDDDDDEDYQVEDDLADGADDGKPSKVDSNESNKTIRKRVPRRVAVHLGNGKWVYNNEWYFETTPQGKFKCSDPSCETQAQRVDTMMRHMRRWHCTGPHGCDECKRSFISAALLKRHSCKMPNSTRMPNSLSIDCGDGKFLYRNEWPFEVYDDGSNTIIESNKMQLFKCGTCFKIRRGRNNMSAHIKRFHADKIECICEICGKLLGNKESFHEHMQIHSGAFHICHVCGKQFKLRQSLYSHKKAHENTLYKCPYEGCDKVLTTRGGLYFHRKTHANGNKPQYECPKCHKYITHKHGLKAHLRKFCSGDRNDEDNEEDGDDGRERYKCDFKGCLKVLTTKGGLYFHKKTHENGGIPQNECPGCHKFFMQKHGLKVHMKRCEKVPKT